MGKEMAGIVFLRNHLFLCFQDVLSPVDASFIALEAHRAGRSAADALVNKALEEMPRMNVIDNITAIVVFLNET